MVKVLRFQIWYEKTQDIIYLFLRFKIYMTNAAFWNELKLIVRGRVFFLPRMADQRKVKLFSSIIFLSLCFKKKQEVVLQICHCIYSHKFHSMYVDDIRNTDLSRIIISLLWFVLRVNSSRSLWIKRFIISLLICYIFSFIQDPFTIKEPHYFVSGGFSLQVITLLSLVAIGFVEVKI